MGRYYDDKISLDGLDNANANFLALRAAAAAVEQAEIDWYKRRREGFNQLDFGGFNKSESQVEADYASLIPGLSVYEFKDTFEGVNPPRKAATNVFRFVHNTFDNMGITDGYSTERYETVDEDDDGNLVYGVADDVLNYHVGRGKGMVDTLYDDLSAFTTSSESSKDFYTFVADDEGSDFVPTFDVFKGFSEVPLAFVAVSGYTSQELQVINAAGNDYDNEVGPVIAEYKRVLQLYIDGGGGDLEDSSVVYKGVKAGDFVVGVRYQITEVNDTNFTLIGAVNNVVGTRFTATGAGTGEGIAIADMLPYENFVGVSTSYNRPQDLEPDLIKETRGFG